MQDTVGYYAVDFKRNDKLLQFKKDSEQGSIYIVDSYAIKIKNVKNLFKFTMKKTMEIAKI